MTNTKAKDNSSRDQDRYISLIQEELNNMPSYVKDYEIEADHSITTEYQYLTEFRRFFSWLRSSGISEAKDNSHIRTETLEHLSTKDIHYYIDYLKHHKNKQGKTNSATTINRSLRALGSLFRYLTVEAEDENGEPYFYRNVMLKIKPLKNEQTLNSRARALEPLMYRGSQKHEWLDFIEHDFVNTCTPKGKAKFLKNKERDLAVIATIFGTAARRSEVTNLDLKDLHLDQGLIDFMRKGGFKDTVPIASWTIPYLQRYLEVRESKYNPPKDNKAFFVTSYMGKTKRITGNTINNIVKKYSVAFGRPTTPHKLRHSVASELFDNEKDQVLVAQQLGQTTTSATDLYTHVDQREQKVAMNKLK